MKKKKSFIKQAELVKGKYYTIERLRMINCKTGPALVADLEPGTIFMTEASKRALNNININHINYKIDMAIVDDDIQHFKIINKN